MTIEKYSNPGRGNDLRKTGNKTWQVGKLWEMHHEVMRYIMLGYKNIEIAKRMGITQEHVSSIRNSPAVQERLALMVAARDVNAIEISRDIMRMAPKSLNLLNDIIAGTGDGKKAGINLRAKVAESNLDRAGFSPVKKVLSENHNYFTDKDIEEMKNRARDNSDVVDAEFDISE